MFKVGDIVRIKNIHNHQSWYSEDDFIICVTGEIVILNKKLNNLYSTYEIYYSFLEYSPLQIRKDKINKLKECLQKKK